MLKIASTFLALFAIVTQFGCATLINGSYQKVRVNTDPEGAKCTVWERSFITPAKISLWRGTNHPIVCRLAGFEPASAMISGRLSGWALVDAPGILPLLLAFETGAAFRLMPEELTLYLHSDQDSPAVPLKHSGGQ